MISVCTYSLLQMYIMYTACYSVNAAKVKDKSNLWLMCAISCVVYSQVIENKFSH